MHPKQPEEKANQGDLFRSSLEQILNTHHRLYILANRIDWDVFTEAFGAQYCDNVGRPGAPMRVMVGLHYLKQMVDESDETVVEKFIENPYWQYFCGFTHFQHRFPIDPSSMTRFRKRIGVEGVEKLLQETLEVAKRAGAIKRSHVKKVVVDTTVQEKAIAFPTDARLYHKARKGLVRAAKERGISLRQSYTRLGKRALLKQSRYAHAKQMRRARRETKKLRTYLGRVIRDITRKMSEGDEALQSLLQHCQRIHDQQRPDKNKVYSVHAPEVECIAKGKAHKRYEFGCKVSIVTSVKDNWVLGIDALHHNPYDGHTLKQAIAQSEELTGYSVEYAFCDRGYRGTKKVIPDVEVILAGTKRLTRTFRKHLKRRNAIELIIGHLKTEHRLNRNYLKGMDGDRMNAMLAGCGFNLCKLLGVLAPTIFLSFLRLLALGWLQTGRPNGPFAAGCKASEEMKPLGLFADRTQAVSLSRSF